MAVRPIAGPDARAPAPCWCRADFPQIARPQPQITEDAGNHADRRGPEAPVPADGLAEGAGHQRRQHGTQIDAEIVDGEAGIPARIIRQIQLPDHHRRTGFEKTRADDDERQSCNETDDRSGSGLQRHRRPRFRCKQFRCRQQNMAAGDDAAADHQGAVGTQPPVGQQAAEDRGQVHGPGVDAIEQVGGFFAPAEAGIHLFRRIGGNEVEHQQRAHAVVAEALPHLGDEQHPDSARLIQHTASRRCTSGEDSTRGHQPKISGCPASREPVSIGPCRHPFTHSSRSPACSSKVFI